MTLHLGGKKMRRQQRFCALRCSPGAVQPQCRRSAVVMLRGFRPQVTREARDAAPPRMRSRGRWTRTKEARRARGVCFVRAVRSVSSVQQQQRVMVVASAHMPVNPHAAGPMHGEMQVEQRRTVHQSPHVTGPGAGPASQAASWDPAAETGDWKESRLEMQG